MTNLYRKFTSKEKASRLIFIITALSVLLLAFQNCSQSSLTKITNPLGAATQKDSGGNGEPYDGKLSYTRLVPGLTCTDQNIAIGTLDIHGDTATVVTNSDSCKNSSTSVSVSDLEFSSFSSEYVGYGDGVYTYLENRSENIEKGIFTEAWCRAMTADRSASAYEFAVQWQDQGQTAKLSVMSNANPNQIKTTSQRQLEADRVHYVLPDGKGTLTVNFKRKIPNSKKASGSFFGSIDGEPAKAVQVECLMGGQFDAVAPTFDYPGSTHKTVAIGDSVADLVPQVNKPTVRFTIHPNLPIGLRFNSTNGSITGSSLGLMPRQKFLVSAQFSFGNVSREVSIAVGQVQIVDKQVAGLPARPCENAFSNCDLSGAVALANRLDPLPLIVRINVPVIQFQNQFEVTGDLSLHGSLIERTLFDANTLSGHFLVQNGHLEFNHIELVNGKNKKGGSINAVSSTVIVNNSIFSNNSAENSSGIGYGGAIAAFKSNLEIVNSKFSDNQGQINGTGGAGAIFLEQTGSVFIKDTYFLRNKSQLGGAIYSAGASEPVFKNCVFDSNWSFKGGAIFSYNGDISIEHSRFVKNESIFDGGALFLSEVSRAWVNHSTFDGNLGAGFGSAAIYFQGSQLPYFFGMTSTLFLLETQFLNQASSLKQSGVVLHHHGEIVFQGVSFSQNNQLMNCRSLSDNGNAFLSIGANIFSDQTCVSK